MLQSVRVSVVFYGWTPGSDLSLWADLLLGLKTLWWGRELPLSVPTEISTGATTHVHPASYMPQFFSLGQHLGVVLPRSSTDPTLSSPSYKGCL